MLPEIDKKEAGVDLALMRRLWMKNQDPTTSPSAETRRRLCIGTPLRMTHSRKAQQGIFWVWLDRETGWINVLLKDSRTGI